MKYKEYIAGLEISIQINKLVQELLEERISPLLNGNEKTSIEKQ